MLQDWGSSVYLIQELVQIKYLRVTSCSRTFSGDISLFLPNATADDDVSNILEVQSISPNAARSWFNEGEVIAGAEALFS